MYSVSTVSESIMLTLMLALSAIGIVLLIVWILDAIAKWNIFKKAGEAGWKGIIPIYSDYVLYKIVWKPSMFWITLVISIITAILSTITSMQTASVVNMGTAYVNYGVIMALSLIQMILGIIIIVISVKFCVKTARAFGKGNGFAVGLFFLDFIFLLILGLGSSQYKGNDSQRTESN